MARIFTSKDQKRLTRGAARRVLKQSDKAALPFLGKKYTNSSSPEYGMWQEDRLVNHIVERLKLSNNERMIRIQRMQEIDIQLSGVVKFTKEEKKRDRNNKKGRKPKAVPHNLPLAYSQLDDCTTYCMSLFAPEMDMFIATSTAKKQYVAEGLTKEIGKHGQVLQYYRNVSRFVFNALKYNLGAISCCWESQKGIVYQAKDSDLGGQITPTEGVVWEGNALKACNMYNFFYDTSVHPCDLPLRGEFFAEVEVVTPFRARRMAEQNVIFGIDRFINSANLPVNTGDGPTFYIQPPNIRETTEAGNATNFREIWAVDSSRANSSIRGLEFAWFTGWLNASDFSLSDDPGLELWMFCLVNGQWIGHASRITSSHQQLPVACSAPIEDDNGNDQRTYAEMLLPLQHFASFLMNTHVDATRKAIYGITVYDKNAFPGLDMDTEDLIGMRIPMKSPASSIDIDKMFRHYTESPDTDRNVEMVGKIAELMQKILPTNMANQVADLQRATEYQAAATVQASSRRNLKIARIINDQAMTPIKFQMMYNLYENLKVIIYTDSDGVEQKITPRDILEAEIEFDVGTGLKGMDRLMQVSIFKDLMAYLFQVKDIGQEVDLLSLLSYVTQIAGFKTDLSTFKKVPVQPQVPAGAETGNPPQQPVQPAPTQQ
jgi:hypothetical protein